MNNPASSVSPPPIRLVIVLEGGLVQNAIADVPVEILVVDRDVDAAQDSPDVGLVRDRLATVVPWSAADLPEVVEVYFQDAAQAGLIP